MGASSSRAVAIINPSTRGNFRRIIELLELAAPPEVDLEVFVTESEGHGRELAGRHAPGADLLIAVGGDGTVAEVAGAAREAGRTIGIIPGGSTNIVARGLGIPRNPYQAIQLLFGPHTVRTIDAGLAGERVFLHMAGAGVDSSMFDLADPALKRKAGWMAYVPAAMAALRKPMATYTIEAAEQRLEGVKSPLVLVANGASVISPALRLDNRISVEDGWLDVLVVTATSPAALARVFARMAMRQMGESPFVTAFRTRDVSIASDPPMAIQLDGDVAGTTPARFTIDPASMRIVVPQTS